MTPPLTATEAAIVGLFIESVLYGIYVVSLGHCLRVLLLRRNRLVLKRASEIRWTALTVSLTMAIISTLDIALNLSINLVAFTTNVGHSDPDTLLNDTMYWMNLMGYVNYIALTAIGDGILVSRLYLVYGRSRKIVVLPVLMYLSGIGGALVILGLGIAGNDLGDFELEPLMFASFALTVVLNVCATSLIIWKLWKLRARVYTISLNPDKFLAIIRIMLDSGLLYTISVIVLISTLWMDNVSVCTSSAVKQIIGIAFNLIIVRINDATAGPYCSDGIVAPPLPTHGSTQMKTASGNSRSAAFSSDIVPNVHCTVHSSEPTLMNPSVHDRSKDSLA